MRMRDSIRSAEFATTLPLLIHDIIDQAIHQNSNSDARTAELKQDVDSEWRWFNFESMTLRSTDDMDLPLPLFALLRTQGLELAVQGCRAHLCNIERAQRAPKSSDRLHLNKYTAARAQDQQTGTRVNRARAPTDGARQLGCSWCGQLPAPLFA
jgi:hypothetical protein